MNRTQDRSTEQTRERLLNAASQEILEKGYAGASLARIAARLGQTKGSLGYHFPTKETILESLMERLVNTDERASQRAWDAFPGQPSRALLAHIATYTFLAATDASTAAAALMSYDPSVPISYGRESYVLWEGRFSDYLEEAVRVEDYHLNMTASDAARLLIISTTGDYVASKFQDQPRELPRVDHLGFALTSIGLLDTSDIESDVRARGFFFSLAPEDLATSN